MSRNLLTVKQFAAKYPAFTEPGLRWIIFHSTPRKNRNGDIPANGFIVAIFRVGGKVLIDEDRFYDFLDSQQQCVA